MRTAVLMMMALAAPVVEAAPPPRVAVILDQGTPRSQPLLEALQREVQGFFRPGEITLLPSLEGDGTLAGVRPFWRVLSGIRRSRWSSPWGRSGPTCSLGRAGPPSQPLPA
ncbi:MAG TPA: hypothetical protein VFO95_17895 [Gemmatimonadales bacterium]|nr:hypothetical protein [Gemmatimonadales bacterium]